jgi:hypothetical protein
LEGNKYNDSGVITKEGSWSSGMSHGEYWVGRDYKRNLMQLMVWSCVTNAEQSLYIKSHKHYMIF